MKSVRGPHPSNYRHTARIRHNQKKSTIGLHMQINAYKTEKLVNHLCWKEKENNHYNLHCECAFVFRVVAESVKEMQLTYSTQTYEQIQRAALTETHTCIDPRKDRHTRPQQTCSSIVFFSPSPLPVLSVDRYSHMIKDCPLPAWHCWLKWSRSNYCNNGENGWGAY